MVYMEVIFANQQAFLYSSVFRGKANAERGKHVTFKVNIKRGKTRV
jgi:hypothetical protein